MKAGFNSADPGNSVVKAADIALFAGLNEEECKLIDEASQTSSYERGDTVFNSGDPAEYFFVVQSGRMKVYFLQKDGREQILYIYGAGDFIGGLNLVQETDYIYTAETLEDTLIVRIAKNAFLSVLQSNLTVKEKVMDQLWMRLRWAEGLVGRLSMPEAENRVAQLLLDLIPEYGRQTARGIWLPLTLTQDEMGNFTGLTRETVTRQLRRLVKDGLIQMERGKGILLPDPAWLKDRINQV